MKLLNERTLSGDSVDTQIDTYIVEFEAKALSNKPVKDPEDAEGAPPEAEMTPEQVVRRGIGAILKENIAYLTEADEEQKGGFEDLDLSPSKKDSESGSGTNFKINVNAPEKPNRVPENLDIDTFVANVARLMNHATELLSVEKVIYNRAMSFLEENYDEDTKKMAEMSIKTNFDVDVEPKEFIGNEKTAIEREY
jgi:hypothetical protein